MNARRLALILRAGLCGIALLCLADLAETQPDVEAYRYDSVQKFIVSNQIIFGGDTSNISFLYSYDPDQISQLQNESDDVNPVILRPRDNGWWARPSYEVIQPSRPLCTHPGEYCRALEQGELAAVGRQLNGVKFQDIFIVENPE